VAVAADSGNGVSAALDIRKYLFVSCDLTISLPPSGWRMDLPQGAKLV
jgi:hypothetical protein